VTLRLQPRARRDEVTRRLILSATPFTMVPRPQSSAAGVLALLSEDEPVIREHALKTLNSLVTQFWAEISEQISLMCVPSVRAASETA
jgi:hypothetical protein